MAADSQAATTVARLIVEPGWRVLQNLHAAVTKPHVDLPPPEWTFEAVVASAEISKGSDKTAGRGFARLRGEAERGALFAGALAQNVRLEDGADAELHLYAGLRREWAGFALEAFARREFYPGTRAGAQSGEWEFGLSAAREVAGAEWTASIEYSPDPLGGASRSVWAEIEVEAPLGGRISAVGALGRRERDGASDYTAWNAGLSYRLTERVAAELRWFDNDAGEPGDRARDLTVVRLIARL